MTRVSKFSFKARANVGWVKKYPKKDRRINGVFDQRYIAGSRLFPIPTLSPRFTPTDRFRCAFTHTVHSAALFVCMMFTASATHHSAAHSSILDQDLRVSSQTNAWLPSDVAASCGLHDTLIPPVPRRASPRTLTSEPNLAGDSWLTDVFAKTSICENTCEPPRVSPRRARRELGSPFCSPPPSPCAEHMSPPAEAKWPLACTATRMDEWATPAVPWQDCVELALSSDVTMGKNAAQGRDMSANVCPALENDMAASRFAFANELNATPRPWVPMLTSHAPPPPAAGPAVFSVFVGGLEPEVTDEDLVRHFANPPEWPHDHAMCRVYAHIRKVTGPIWTMPTRPSPFTVHSARVIRETTGAKSHMYGFVRLTSQVECDRALMEMQHTLLVPRRRPLHVLCIFLRAADGACPLSKRRESRRPPRRSTPSEPDQVVSVPAPAKSVRSASNQRAKERTRALSPRSDTTDVPIETVPTTLTFMSDGKSESAAKKQPHLASALKLAHTSSALDPSNTTVFVGSLFSMATEQTLHSLFSRFGHILSINIPRGQDCGFVQFARKRDAARAISEMQRFPIAGGTLRLSWGRGVSEKVAARAATRAGLRWIEDIA